MACNNTCKLCDRLIISTAVTFTAGTGLIITIPQNVYNNGCKYCIVVAQTIPPETTISAPVYIQIGTGTVLYPLDKCNCLQATACAIRTRTKYSVKVVTSTLSSTFRLLGKTCCEPDNSTASIDGTPVA